MPEEADAPEVRLWRADAVDHGLRLDKVLVRAVPEFSRNYLQNLVDRGAVEVEGQVAAQASRKVRAGQSLRITLWPTAQSAAFRPEPMALQVLFEDEHLMVIDKPVGLVVHPAPGHWSGTLLNGLLAHHGAALALPRAGIVHRLDKDTSGLMVVAKSLPAHTALVRAIADRSVQRLYRAIAHGLWHGREREVDAPVGRDPVSRVRMAVTASGRPSRTTVTPVACGLGLSALECRLHTGRTHQIRVHLSHCGHPLLGDVLYGGRLAHGLERQALHAYRLAFEHPVEGRPLAFESPLPADMASVWMNVLTSG